jgi:hypothetical protein
MMSDGDDAPVRCSRQSPLPLSIQQLNSGLGWSGRVAEAARRSRQGSAAHTSATTMPRRAVSTVVKVIDPSLLLEIVRMPVRWLPPAGPCTPLDSFAGADMCDSMLTVGGSSGSPHAITATSRTKYVEDTYGRRKRRLTAAVLRVPTAMRRGLGTGGLGITGSDGFTKDYESVCGRIARGGIALSSLGSQRKYASLRDMQKAKQRSRPSPPTRPP